MQILGLILARGGSQRVANKNIRSLGGIPLLAHTLKALKDSKHITRMIVTTNDEAIASVARQFGAETPFSDLKRSRALTLRNGKRSPMPFNG